MRVSDILGNKRIDLNVDIGEGFSNDEALLEFATSANICCGEHAGSRELSLETVALCDAKRIRYGAHPGYPDRASMGRAPLELENQRTYFDSIRHQVSWFSSVAKPAYLKPHGAFYNETAIVLPADWDSAMARVDTPWAYEAGGVFLAQYPGIQTLMVILRIHKLPLMGLSMTTHRVIAERAKLPLIEEGFADRAYLEDGTLMPRGLPGAVHEDFDLIAAQVLDLAPRVDSICLHGDTPNCLEFAELVYKTLVDAGYEVVA